MKAILMSIKPKWVAKILNGEKTIEIRKKFPKDFVGWVYIYCTKGGKKDWHLIEVIDTDTGWEGYEYDYYIGSKGYLKHCLEGKVVARFWCDTVEEIECYSYLPDDWDYDFETELMGRDELYRKSCLSKGEIACYLLEKNGYAIHITKLEIFDKPEKADCFLRHQPIWKTCNNHYYKSYQLTRAPQSWCYVEV